MHAVLAVLALGAPALGPPARAAAQEEPPGRGGHVAHVPGSIVLDVHLEPGEELQVGTCGIAGATYVGDTTLAVIGPRGEQVAFSDDACWSYGSQVRWRVPEGGGGRYAVRAGCYGGGIECSGTIAYRVGPPEPSSQPSALRLAAAARGVLSLDPEGGALVGDALLEWRPIEGFALRIGGTPAALAGGSLGGVAGGSLHAVAVLDDGLFAIGAGLGVSVLGERVGGVRDQQAPALAAYVRVGRLHMFHVEAQLGLGVIRDQFEILSLMVMARLPLPGVDLFVRGAGGADGVALGEVGAVVWAVSEGTRPVFGVSLHAGGAGAFYQATCRFGTPCRDTTWYAGPMLGVGLEWRP